MEANGPLNIPYSRIIIGKKLFKTRMHSSRMRTVHCSGRLSCHTCPPATHTPCHACIPPATHASPYTHAPLAMRAPCYTCPPPCMPPCHAHPCHACPPLVDRMTDACENITFLQLLLRTVVRKKKIFHITFPQLLLRTVMRKKR